MPPYANGLSASFLEGNNTQRNPHPTREERDHAEPLRFMHEALKDLYEFISEKV